MSFQDKSLPEGSKGDHLDSERESQRLEFLRREKRRKPPQKKIPPRKNHHKKRSTKPLERQLAQTIQWLEETFPHLFTANDYLPLSDHILMELKQEYKANQVRKNYPGNLVLRAALSRYKSSSGYLYCLKEGTPKYALDGSIAGYVTKEEAIKVQQAMEK